MEISVKEAWTVFHGMIFGAIYLLAFGGAIAEIYSLPPDLTTTKGINEKLHRLKIGLWLMTVISWITVISGTWIVYVWYRAKPISGEELYLYPRYFLLSKDSTKLWHSFGMEWKEHSAWIAPMLTTSVAYTVQIMGEKLAESPRIRKTLILFLIISFGCSAVAGIFGAFINKIAATR